ncbi:alpha-amylase family protein [Actinoplanes sp. NPDC049548]|uniref:alpha-amylase n=1 Tax=Actinoplanes sp. NPDC049548 TaxID=3155152 RepID=UPI00341A0F32
MGRRRWAAVLVAVLMATGLNALAAQRAGAAPGAKDVIVTLFEWNWVSVERECRDYLGPKGYGYVQVSPPQEHIKGGPWWASYQPVSYKVDSNKGDRGAFERMVDACHDAGVKVIADVVINHMAEGSGNGWAGSHFGDREYDGIYKSWDFHDGCVVQDSDYRNDAWRVRNCDLLRLPDLKTETDYVRTKLAAYMNDLLSLDVDGFRVDAAKHMTPDDINAIKGKLGRTTAGTQPYLVQEVIWGQGEPITPEQYTGVGEVHEFRYGRDLKRVFQNEKLAYLQNFGEAWGFVNGTVGVPFVDNHDTQRNGTTLSYKDNATYTLANVFMLAWPYGSPSVMSGFEFAAKDQGAPKDGNGRIKDVTCFNGEWKCEHRWPQIGNMVAFHNAVKGTAVTHWWSNGNDQIAFGRGDKGFVVINDEGTGGLRSYQTGLPAGTYCDVIKGQPTPTGCSGDSVTVDASGWFTATVGAHDAVALHVNARAGT